MADFKLTPEWFVCARAADEIGALADEVDAFVDRVLEYSGPMDPEPAEHVAVAA
jgi:hypothetical protein